MEMEITFPGEDRVDAHFGAFTVETDQPPMGGGEGAAPTPFALFLASIGTCAGIYVLGFLKQRKLSTEGVRINQRMHHDPATGRIYQIDLAIEVPPGFPERYRGALVKSAELCAVKKHLQQPPAFNITTRTAESMIG